MREGNRFTPTIEDPPLQVVEYRATGDPWRVLVACVLLNRTHRNAVDRVWPGLMDRWATAEEMATAHAASLEGVLQPLGLQRARAQKLWSLSGLWSVAQTMRPSAHPLIRGPADVERLPGCGGYAAETWRVVVDEDLTRPCEDRVIEGWRWIMLESRRAVAK